MGKSSKMRDLNNLYILYAWTKVSKKRRNQTIDGISRVCLEDLCHCFREIIKGKVPLTEDQLIALQRYKKELRTLSSTKVSYEKKKKELKRKGLIEALTKNHGRKKRKTTS